MRRLGISIYPEKSSLDDIFKYLKDAREIGASRIFSCLLSVNKEVEIIKKEFKKINEYAKSLGYEIIVDVSPKVFNDLGISYKNLEFFKEILCDGIRLDMGFTGNEESLMTFNKENLKIEINMSNDTSYIDTIMEYRPNKYNLIGCHNFYPHRYTGLNLSHFINCNKRFKKYGLRLASFITSQNKNAFGPWPALEGLPTLEVHRDMPIDIQLKHYILLDDIDDIIISNCYPSKEELEKISKVNLNILNLNVKLIDNIPDVEKSIVLDELHFQRGDFNDNMLRSTQSRVKYKGHKFEVFNTPFIKRGDIIIESSEYGHYAGELQIALEDMENSGKSNVVGKIVDEELFLLKEIKPWQKFIFTELK